MSKAQTKRDDPAQSKRFIELAQESGAGSSTALARAVKKMAAHTRKEPKAKAKS